MELIDLSAEFLEYSVGKIPANGGLPDQKFLEFAFVVQNLLELVRSAHGPEFGHVKVNPERTSGVITELSAGFFNTRAVGQQGG